MPHWKQCKFQSKSRKNVTSLAEVKIPPCSYFSDFPQIETEAQKLFEALRRLNDLQFNPTYSPTVTASSEIVDHKHSWHTLYYRVLSVAAVW